MKEENKQVRRRGTSVEEEEADMSKSSQAGGGSSSSSSRWAGPSFLESTGELSVRQEARGKRQQAALDAGHWGYSSKKAIRLKIKADCKIIDRTWLGRRNKQSINRINGCDA